MDFAGRLHGTQDDPRKACFLLEKEDEMDDPSIFLLSSEEMLRGVEEAQISSDLGDVSTPFQLVFRHLPSLGASFVRLSTS